MSKNSSSSRKVGMSSEKTTICVQSEPPRGRGRPSNPNILAFFQPTMLNAWIIFTFLSTWGSLSGKILSFLQCHNHHHIQVAISSPCVISFEVKFHLNYAWKGRFYDSFQSLSVATRLHKDMALGQRQKRWSRSSRWLRQDMQYGCIVIPLSFLALLLVKIFSSQRNVFILCGIYIFHKCFQCPLEGVS